MNENVQAYNTIICDGPMQFILSENFHAEKEAISSSGRLHIGSFYNIISLCMMRLCPNGQDI